MLGSASPALIAWLRILLGRDDLLSDRADNDPESAP